MDLFNLNMVSVIYKGIVISPGENSPVHILHVDIEQGQLLQWRPHSLEDEVELGRGQAAV